MKKLYFKLAVFLIFINMITFVNANGNSNSLGDGYFIFDGAKQIEFASGQDVKKISQDFVLQDKDNNTYDAVVNILSDNKIAISPIKKTSSALRIKDVTSYTVTDYEKNMYVQNKKNLDRITKALEPQVVPYTLDFNVQESSRRDSATSKSASPNSASLKTSMSDGGSTPSHSTTNVQTEGVDEADIVKTDGKYIYFVRENHLVIVNANTKNLKVITNIYSKDNTFLKDLYVDKNILTLIYKSNKVSQNGVSSAITIVDNYDISNINSPKKINSTTVNGSYNQSRKQGDVVYLLTDDYFRVIYNNPMPRPLEKRATVQDKREFVPTTNFEYSSEGMNLEKMLYLPFNPAPQVINMTAISTGLGLPKNQLSYMSDNGTVYMSNDNIYIATPIYNFDVKKGSFENLTNIKKFSVNKLNFNYMGYNEVKGSLVNQFSLSENKGDLFVAYTSNVYTSNIEKRDNMVTSFDKDMKLISTLSGLAPSEKIYSTRFIKDRLYMVTFKNVDPLFVIDIKNAKAMKVLGYLKIPGYSNYLHPYKENYLIGFGQQTKQKDVNSIVNDGFKIALFDVSDVSKPKQIDVQNIGARGTSSEVESDHKSLMFDYTKDVFAFPIRVTKSIKKVYNGQSYDDISTSFIGAYVYKVSDKGFNLKGRISHYNDKQKQNITNDVYEYRKTISRIVQIGNNVYTLSDYGIVVNNIDTLKEVTRLVYDK